jgi:hypothetical protein
LTTFFFRRVDNGSLKTLSFLGGGGTGFELKALVKQALYCLSHTSSPFCSGYLEIGRERKRERGREGEREKEN